MMIRFLLSVARNGLYETLYDLFDQWEADRQAQRGPKSKSKPRYAFVRRRRSPDFAWSTKGTTGGRKRRRRRRKAEGDEQEDPEDVHIYREARVSRSSGDEQGRKKDGGKERGSGVRLWKRLVEKGRALLFDEELRLERRRVDVEKPGASSGSSRKRASESEEGKPNRRNRQRDERAARRTTTRSSGARKDSKIEHASSQPGRKDSYRRLQELSAETLDDPYREPIPLGVRDGSCRTPGDGQVSFVKKVSSSHKQPPPEVTDAQHRTPVASEISPGKKISSPTKARDPQPHMPMVNPHTPAASKTSPGTKLSSPYQQPEMTVEESKAFIFGE